MILFQKYISQLKLMNNEQICIAKDKDSLFLDVCCSICREMQFRHVAVDKGVNIQLGKSSLSSDILRGSVALRNVNCAQNISEGNNAQPFEEYRACIITAFWWRRHHP